MEGFFTEQHIGVFMVGIIVGFLGGLFGKGGSAIATPMLSLVGIPDFIAVAAPLPATIPGTFIASVRYWKAHMMDWKLVWWTVGLGVPATVFGSWLTKYIGALPLLIITGAMVLGFGISFLLAKKKEEPDDTEAIIHNAYSRWRVIAVALFVGLSSGLLGNSGGFLLAPLFVRFLGLPIKQAFAASLMSSVFIAIPGTIVHAYLGHIDWMVTLVLMLGSVPCSYLGAKLAIKAKSYRLERWYGVALTALGIFFLWDLW